MNKLSSCKLFEMVDSVFKNSLKKTLQTVASNVEKYTVEFNLYDFFVKSMRNYKYPLSRLIVHSALAEEIKPILLANPKDKHEKEVFMPSAIPTFTTMDNKSGYVDISPRADYIRDKLGRVESLKIKEIDLYAYLNMAFLDLYLKKSATAINKSSAINKNIAIAYSRLFSKCIDRTFPISAKIERFNVSIFLSSVFCLVQFFEYDIETAMNIVFSSGISNRAEMETECKILKENKLDFINIEDFLKLYNYEFSDYIKQESLSLRIVVNMFQRMYGPNSWFAIEHAGSFFNMILSTPIGLYNDKFISKTIKIQVDNINSTLVTLLSKKV